MNINLDRLYRNIYTFAFLGCIAVLPMSDTIALRNILLVLMLLLIFIGSAFSSGVRKEFLSAIKIIPMPLLVWALYLCVFPLWAPMSAIAWENLRGQWGESLFAWTAGLGAAVVFRGSGPGLWGIGFASAFPLIVHLLLAGLAYCGLLSADYYGHQNLAGLMHEFGHWLRSESITYAQYHPLERAFLGIETQPGNIGYASSMAIGIFALIFFLGKDNHDYKASVKASFFIVLCFLSVFIARTRGGFIFGLLVIGLAAMYVKISGSPPRANMLNPELSGRAFRRMNLLIFIAILAFTCISYLGMKSDPRWETMADKVKAGFAIADPISSLCNGLTATEELSIRDRLADRPAPYAQDVIDGVRGQDGGRVILMRAGIHLVMKNPIGLDGSRQSYERLIKLECNGTPALYFANAHNSWVDLSLALGWVGVILFLILLIYFIRYAFRYDSVIEGMPLVMLLGTFATFWIIRGFFDTLFREHYLQMQGLIIGYLYMASAMKFPVKNAD